MEYIIPLEHSSSSWTHRERLIHTLTSSDLNPITFKFSMTMKRTCSVASTPRKASGSTVVRAQPWSSRRCKCLRWMNESFSIWKGDNDRNRNEKEGGKNRGEEYLYLYFFQFIDRQWHSTAVNTLLSSRALSLGAPKLIEERTKPQNEDWRVTTTEWRNRAVANETTPVVIKRKKESVTEHQEEKLRPEERRKMPELCEHEEERKQVSQPHNASTERGTLDNETTERRWKMKREINASNN